MDRLFKMGCRNVFTSCRENSINRQIWLLGYVMKYVYGDHGRFSYELLSRNGIVTFERDVPVTQVQTRG
jgi:hypothetical protein